MPVLNCPCGAEVRVSPGRMLAMGNEPFVCPDCGLCLVDDHAGLIEQPAPEFFSAAAADDDDEVEFAELPSGGAINDEESSNWFDVEFAALENADEPAPDGLAEDGLADAVIHSDVVIRSDADMRDDADIRTDADIQSDTESLGEPDDRGDGFEGTMTAAEHVAEHVAPSLRVDIVLQPAVPPAKQWRMHTVAFSASLLFHFLTVLLLALFILPTLIKPASDVIELNSEWTPADGVESRLTDDDAVMANVAIAQAANPTAQPGAAEMIAAQSSGAISMAVPDPRLMSTSPPRESLSLPAMPNSSLLVPVKPVRRSDPGRGGLVQGSSPGQATEGILDGIRKEASNGPVQVVWLMDASISMNVDRQGVAARLVPFYREMAQRDKSEGLPLLSSVVTFGEQPVELVKTSRNIDQVVRAVATLQNDPSGLENVMTAVQSCLLRYANKKSTLIIVIFTDESGDDILKLEQTIELCRQRNAIVHVVGPNAVFGSERGTHLWRDAESGYTFQLPVKRGPETSLPERLMIPYWHDSKFPAARMNGNLVAQDLPWFGGPMREGILSGFGPYALTRLAMQTGGTFTVLDRPGDRTIATLEQLRPYTPDYASAREYYSETLASPLRRAVSEAAMFVWQAPELTPPPRTFLFSTQAFYPFGSFVNFLNPENFRVGFRKNLQTALKGSRAELEIMEQALALFEAKNLEDEYEKETSLRWKAWYDVNYGRLLANTVRHIEYQLTCEQILASGALNPDTNHVMFLPSAEYKGGRVSAGRAVLARRLLERCRKNNPGTQWDKLAEWELEHELGMQVQQVVIPPPPPFRGSFVPIPPMKPISFPRL